MTHLTAALELNDNYRMAVSDDRILIERAIRVAQLIQQGTSKPADIIQAINQIPRLAYNRHGNATTEAHQKALQQDLKRLKGLGQSFEYDKKSKCYVARQADEISLPLGFSDDELAVLAQLFDMQQVTPLGQVARGLHAKLAARMPLQQRKKFLKRPLIAIKIPALDELSDHLATAQTVMEAFETQQELTFQYQGSAHSKAYTYRVQVLSPVELRDGHAYFEARSLQSEMEWDGLRLDRVVPKTATLLPTKQPNRTKHPYLVPLKYWLAKHVGRPTKHFPIDFACETREDGYVISAKIDERDLFRAMKILLRYGENCMVSEPPALVDEMRRTVEEMARLYMPMD